MTDTEKKTELRGELLFNCTTYMPLESRGLELSWGGGMEIGDPESWSDYLDRLGTEKRPYLEAAKVAFEESDYVGNTCSLDKCKDCDKKVFWACLYIRFADNVVLTFSPGSYADFMQALVNKREGYRTYYEK